MIGYKLDTNGAPLQKYCAVSFDPLVVGQYEEAAFMAKVAAARSHLIDVNIANYFDMATGKNFIYATGYVVDISMCDLVPEIVSAFAAAL